MEHTEMYIPRKDLSENKIYRHHRWAIARLLNANVKTFNCIFNFRLWEIFVNNLQLNNVRYNQANFRQTTKLKSLYLMSMHQNEHKNANACVYIYLYIYIHTHIYVHTHQHISLLLFKCSIMKLHHKIPG